MAGDVKAERPLLVWFSNHHEHSLHYLKFGLMQLARQGEIRSYRQRFEELLSRYGAQFAKVRPWVPIGPDLEWHRPRRKLANVCHKLQLRWCGTVDWLPQLERFSARWAHIKSLRTVTPSLDVALLDSLWGWPRHRIALHQQLAALADQGYAICSGLSHRHPETYELGDASAPDPTMFPMQVGVPISGNYKELLAVSRLGGFATGFHYGWRNIVTPAWALGLKTLQDSFTYMFLFDAAPFHLSLGPEGWDRLEQALDQARLDQPAERQSRWGQFDQVASPDRVAAIFVNRFIAELL